ncbi:MAG: DEAD/DEAH box helicase [Polyangia bacterium]
MPAPTSFAAIPAALHVDSQEFLLSAPVAEFLVGLPSAVRHVVKVVSSILRCRQVRDLCREEAEVLVANRFSSEVAANVRDHLWNWLSDSPPAGRPDDPNDPDDFDDLDDFDDFDDDEPATGLAKIAIPVPERGRLAAETTASPSILAPPTEIKALEAWCERHGVSERLGDPYPSTSADNFYGFPPQQLPRTVRDAVLVTAKTVAAPRFFRAELAEHLVSSAKAYLHRAAHVLASMTHLQAERTARARLPSDPNLLRFLQLVRDRRDQVAAQCPLRPAGTFLPGRITLQADPPDLGYREWHISEGGVPTSSAGQPFLTVRLAAWDSGQLGFACKRCRDRSSCVHVVTALEEISAALCDPADALAELLAPILRVPGWSRLLGHLDSRLAQVAVPAAEESQRLIWQISRQPEGISVLPIVQKLGKRGAWSRGQRLSLESLDDQGAVRRDPADQAVFEVLMDAREPSAYYYRRSQSLNPRQGWRALAALAGSSRVFAADRSTPLSVRKARVALTLDEVEGGFRLRTSLGGVEVDPGVLLTLVEDGRHLVWLDEERHLCVLALLGSDAMALLGAMAKFPVVLPNEAVDELVLRLPRMQDSLDVHLPDGVRGEQVEPPTTIVCRLEPLPESGLRIAMVVRPIADGPVFAPGEGPPEVMLARDGRRLHSPRPLGAERERGAHLAQALGLDDATSSGPWCWDVSDDRSALEVLGKLRGLPELGSIEWPAGEIRVDRVFRTSLKVAVSRRRDWFGAEGGAEIDDMQISLLELLAAVRAGRRFVKLGPRRFAAIEDDLRDKLAALDDVVFDNQGALEIGLLAAPVLADVVEDPRQLDLVPAFRAVLGKIEAARGDAAVLPAGLQACLRHYQEDGFRWLARLATWGLGACLADDMGLGKTLQALALLLRRSDLGPALVIAPTSVVANWAAESAKFAPGLAVRVYRGPERAALCAALGHGDLLVTSYAIAARDAEALAAIRFATLIVDEAQSVKNALTQRFRAIRDLQADFRVALTGTPIENHLGELWAIFRLVTPGLLGSWEQFRARFALPVERHHDRARQAALARVVRPFLLRRTKAEVAPELPPRTEMNQTIELSPLERRFYEAARIEALQSLATGAATGGDEAQQRIKILAALTRLRLLCCHPRLVVKDSSAGSAKLAALVDLLVELRDEGHRALVFSQFTSFLDIARPPLDRAGLRTLSLDGSTPALERARRVAAFQAGEADAFLLSLRAGGTGLNLTAATYVIHLDPWWNPAVEDQATDRAHRIGQERPVTVIRLVARGTIEEAVLSLHEEKRQLAASILDGADAAARLDSEDLLDLIRRSGADTAEGDVEEESPESP